MSDNNEALYSRRTFVTRGVQLLSVAGTLPLFLDRSAHALAADFAANPQGAGRPDRILVVLQLAGGNDGLNTVVPTFSDEYYKARPRLAIAKKDALKLDDRFGLHPAARGLKRLWEDGGLAVLHAVGYPNPNRSHFRATDIWASAEPEKVARTGWIGRYFDACCAGQDPGPGPDAAVALTNDPPQTLQGDKYLPIAFRSPDSLTYREGRRSGTVKTAFEKLNDADVMPAMMDNKPAMPMGTKGSLQPKQDQAEDFLQRTALSARLYADQIRKSSSAVKNAVSYPSSRLADDLKLIAQMIAAGLPTRVYYVQLGGFDTHAAQAPRHEQLIGQLGDALAAFVADLKALGHLQRTTVMTFSEFGRRVSENGSIGTDHGEAAPLFVAGGAIAGGLYGQFPDLAPAKLHRGDVPWTLDFRRLYASVLRDWLKADDAKVLGGKFEPLKLFKTA